jgi:hypothetical protein
LYDKFYDLKMSLSRGNLKFMEVRFEGEASQIKPAEMEIRLRPEKQDGTIGRLTELVDE